MKIGIFIFFFIVSIGLAALGLMTSYRLKKSDDKPFAPSLFYYVIFLTAFGFYSIWSYLIFEFLLNYVIDSKDTLVNIVGIFPLLGIPLLIVAWYLFIQFCVEFVNLKLKEYVSIIYFSACTMLFLILANYFKNQLIQDEAIELRFIVKIVAIVHFVVVASGCLFLLFKSSPKFDEVKKEFVAGVIFTPVLLAEVSLFMVSSHWLVVILFVAFYFSQLSLIPAYFYFRRSQESTAGADDKFGAFCEEFEISKREAEIIQEICQGKTNQAIADALFITVQTVKDHAHRIYTKTDVKNRIQLSNLVREKVKPEPAKSKP